MPNRKLLGAADRDYIQSYQKIERNPLVEKTQPVAGCSNNCDVLSCTGEFSSMMSSLYRRILNIILISSHTNKSNCLKGWWVGEPINEPELSEMQMRGARC